MEHHKSYDSVSKGHCLSCGAFIDRDIEHPCPMYRTEPPLPPLDPSFRVIPERIPAQLAESLRKVRKVYDRD